MATDIAEIEGVTFDHYKVLTRSDGSLFELGRGAMGITYKAFDTNLRVPVALKVINTKTLDSESARERFVQEARSAAKLRHQHVASVFHLGTEGPTWFYAMEYIAGETVEAAVKRRGPLPPMVVMRIGLQVAKALAAAEQHKLVHRDIKPSNLMLVSADDELAVKVIDFGLAKYTHDEEPTGAQASAANFVGTPHYASPEQLQVKPLDIRSDIYSLGATLFFMLAGQAPFGGAMAQVMNQQLTSPPPLAKLNGVPQPIVALLERMLSKDPALRPQSATDLRREIEQCLVEAGQNQTAATIALEERQIAADTSDRHHDAIVDLTTRMVVAGRYDVLERLGETNDGWVFRANDMSAKRQVRLLLLRQDFTLEPEALTQLEHEIDLLRNVTHANLLQIYGLEIVDRASVISMEWTEGVTLREVLRTRSFLTPSEVLLLLEQMAAGVDHALQRELPGLDLALHQIFIHFPALEREKQGLLAEPISRWPPFEVKLNPLGLGRGFSLSVTWAGAQTVVGRPGTVGTVTDAGESGTAHVRELAILVYEMMGGTLKTVVAASVGGPGSSRYTPLANLTEEANEVMRRAMDPARGFEKAGEFLQALRGVEQLESRVREVQVPKPAETPAVDPGADTVAPNPYAAAHAPEKGMLIPALVSLGAVAVIVAGVTYVALRPHEETPTGTTATPEATPIAVEPVATPAPRIVEATPPPATPAPSTPDPRELLKSAVAKAEEAESRKDLQAAVTEWIQVAHRFPEAEVGKMRLDLLLDDVRLRGEKLSGDELARLTPSLEEAAQLGSTSAMLVLGDSLRHSDPEAAFKWTSLAADKGVPTALTWKGLMLANGTGTAKDLNAAVTWLQKAADSGDPAGLGALGECYLFGKGVEKDPERGVELLQKASAKGDLRAMDRLGTCYQKGLGTAKNFSEARRLFSGAAEKGYGNAIGNLGVLYMRGDGVTPDIRKGLELFQKGAKAGDPYCMLLYAQALEEGVGIDKNATEARMWYQHAAEGGMPPAIDWCRKNGVEFAKAKP